MKTLALLFALSLYLLANPTHSTFNPIRLPTADKAVASDTPVLDSDGDAVRAGGDYYITSIFWGAGAGEVKLGWIDSTTKCPSDVIVSSIDDGSPITITPVDPNANVVLPSTYQSFRFNVPTNRLCVNKVSWGIQYDRGSGQYFLRAGEFVSNLSNQFKIELVQPDLNAYKITYCLFGTDKCYNVGTYLHPWLRTTLLVLSDYPFVVMFKKASV